MTPKQRQRVEELFDRIIDAPAGDRAGMLVQLCPDDTTVRAEVASLLDAPATTHLPGEPDADDSTGFVQQAFAHIGAVAAASQYPAVGKSVGPYRIVELIGEGGMGSVFKAEQVRPHRLVALKVIRPGYMSPVLLKRFEYEADVLARLEHPGIARIYEAGIADTDIGKVPFFAMELVEGQRLDEFVRSTRPPIRQRLDLLVEICSAVHHAHQKGIIHRDLKPANILITRDGHPKVLDFGVARMTDSDVLATTMHTQSGQLVGTLPYMAPEQAAGQVKALDTSSDVYALGVIAFELLSGRKPYDVEGKPLHEAVSVICRDDPTRLSSLDRSLRGDVETIIRKALAKERTRRYATAGEFAADLKRYLDFEPIAARPPSTWYQLRKFARRNPTLVTGVAFAIVALIALSAVLGTGFARERRLRLRVAEEKAAAEQARTEADKVNAFLSNEVLGRADPAKLRDSEARSLIVKTLIEPAAANVGERFKDTPRLEASVRLELSKMFGYGGRTDLGLPHARRALEIRTKLLGPDHPETLEVSAQLVELLRSAGQLAEAETVARETVASLRRTLGEDDRRSVTALSSLGLVLYEQGKYADAEPIMRRVLEVRRRLLGEDHIETLRALQNLAADLSLMGRIEEAEPLLEQAWKGYCGAQGEDHPESITALNNYAFVLLSEGKVAECEPFFRKALEQSQRVLGEDHPDTAQSLNNLALVLARLGRVKEAAPLAERAVKQFRRLKGDAHNETLNAIDNYGKMLIMLGRASEAEPLLAELYRTTATAQVPPDRAALYTCAWGLCLIKLERWSDAEAPLLEGHRRLVETNQTSGRYGGEVIASLTAVYEHTGRPDEAAKWHSELDKFRATTQPAR